MYVCVFTGLTTDLVFKMMPLQHLEDLHLQETFMLPLLYTPERYVQYASKKSVRKVSNGREITFEVLCGVCEMYM